MMTNKNTMAAKNSKDALIWGEYVTPEDEPATWQLGDLRLWYKRQGNEFWVAHVMRPAPEEGEEPQPLPAVDDLSWSRWSFKTPQQKIRLLPVFPDRPVVAKPEHPFRLVKESRARVYIRVPIWLHIESARKTPDTLIELPTAILSNTWFGTVRDGELCYWLTTSARREIKPDVLKNYLAICPLHIINESDDELLVDKVRLQVDGLSIFSQDGQLWADETRVYFRGLNQVSRVEIAGKVPKEAPNAELLSKPRVPVKSSLAIRTFRSVISLPGFDFLR